MKKELNKLEEEYLLGKINIGKIMLFYLTMKNKEIVLSIKRLKEKTQRYKVVNDMIKEKEWDNLAKKLSRYINRRESV